MRILFLLPDIVGKPTGGNIYNELVMSTMPVHVEVTGQVIKRGSDITAEILAGQDGVIVDSLLVTEINPEHHRGNGMQRWFVLTHYLPICDPGRSGEQRESWYALLKTYDGFVTTSQYTASCLEGLDLQRKQICTVYPGLDDTFRSARYPADEDASSRPHSEVCNLLTVSSLLPGKGLIEFVDVLERVNATGWTWTVVGDDSLDGDYARAFKERIKDLGHLHWAGTINPGEMHLAYPQYDLFVLPSRFETLGMAVREAMICGLPAIAYDVGGVSESLADGGGVLVPAFNANRMVEVVGRLINDVERRQQLAAEAAALGMYFPTWQESANRFADFVASFIQA